MSGKLYLLDTNATIAASAINFQAHLIMVDQEFQKVKSLTVNSF